MSVKSADDDAGKSSRRSEFRPGRSAPPAFGVVSGAPRVLLRLEGAVVLAASALAYAHVGGGWAMFVVLFLVPDIFMPGYLAGPRIGAMVYNLGHATIAPAALAACGLGIGHPLAVEIALIWVAHIGFDRLLGFGLKYPTAFAHTHLSRA